MIITISISLIEDAAINLFPWVVPIAFYPSFFIRFTYTTYFIVTTVPIVDLTETLSWANRIHDGQTAPLTEITHPTKYDKEWFGRLKYGISYFHLPLVFECWIDTKRDEWMGGRYSHWHWRFRFIRTLMPEINHRFTSNKIHRWDINSNKWKIWPG